MILVSRKKGIISTTHAQPSNLDCSKANNPNTARKNPVVWRLHPHKELSGRPVQPQQRQTTHSRPSAPLHPVGMIRETKMSHQTQPTDTHMSCAVANPSAPSIKLKRLMHQATPTPTAIKATPDKRIPGTSAKVSVNPQPSSTAVANCWLIPSDHRSVQSRLSSTRNSATICAPSAGGPNATSAASKLTGTTQLRPRSPRHGGLDPSDDPPAPIRRDFEIEQ